jgi:hypothetical protein
VAEKSRPRELTDMRDADTAKLDEFQELGTGHFLGCVGEDMCPSRGDL